MPQRAKQVWYDCYDWYRRQVTRQPKTVLQYQLYLKLASFYEVILPPFSCEGSVACIVCTSLSRISMFFFLLLTQKHKRISVFVGFALLSTVRSSVIKDQSFSVLTTLYSVARWVLLPDCERLEICYPWWKQSLSVNHPFFGSPWASFQVYPHL